MMFPSAGAGRSRSPVDLAGAFIRDDDRRPGSGCWRVRPGCYHNFKVKQAVRLSLVLLAMALAPAGIGQRSDRGKPVRLPSGKLQSEEILKAEHEKTLRDAAELVELSQALRDELEKNGRHVLSIGSIKKTEEIEKLAKRIRGRLRR